MSIVCGILALVGNVLAIFSAANRGQPVYAVLLFVFSYSAPLGWFQWRIFAVLHEAWVRGFHAESFYELQDDTTSSLVFSLALKTFIIFRSYTMHFHDIFIFFVLGVCLKLGSSLPECVIASKIHRTPDEKFGYNVRFIAGVAKPLLPDGEQHVLAAKQALDYYALWSKKREVGLEQYYLLAWPMVLATTLGSAHLFDMSYGAFLSSFATAILVCGLLACIVNRSLFVFLKLLTWPLWIFEQPLLTIGVFHTARIVTVTCYWCFWFWMWPKQSTSLSVDSPLSYVQGTLLLWTFVAWPIEVYEYASMWRGTGTTWRALFVFESPLKAMFWEYVKVRLFQDCRRAYNMMKSSMGLA